MTVGPNFPAVIHQSADDIAEAQATRNHCRYCGQAFVVSSLCADHEQVCQLKR